MIARCGNSVPEYESLRTGSAGGAERTCMTIEKVAVPDNSNSGVLCGLSLDGC